MSGFSIAVTGFARQSAYVARLLETHVPGVRAASYGYGRFSLARAALYALRADASITIGGPGPLALVRAVCEARAKPVVHVWVGSDVQAIARAPEELEQLRLRRVRHWAVSRGLVEELAQLGIDAALVPIASARVPARLAPMPSRFTVLAYLPQPRREFYGQRCVWAAAREMPESRFVVVGEGGPEAGAPPNVEYVGEIGDMDARIDAASVLLRVTEHDGFSQHVVEALGRGRHVIWTQRVPGALHAESADAALAQLRLLRDAHDAGTLSVNLQGAQYVLAHHDPARVASRIAGALQSAAEHMRRTDAHRKLQARRIAISGPPVLGTRVAATCGAYTSAIALTPLCTSTTSDAALSLLALVRSEAWYSIGEPNPPQFFELAARLWRKRRIVHWLGNDVESLSRSPDAVRRYRSARFVHLAQSEEIARRLEAYGVYSRVVSLAALPRVSEVARFPERFTLLLYLPADRPELFGRHQYERLMRALLGESVHYIVVGGGDITVPAGASVERSGWRHDLGDLFDRSTALVRFTQTDSFSAMIVEALMHGRRVLWSNRFPYAVPVGNFHDLERAVRALLDQHLRGDLQPDREAARAMSRLYAPEVCVEGLAQACAAT